MVKDRSTGASKRYAFVQFESDDDAEKALEGLQDATVRRGVGRSDEQRGGGDECGGPVVVRCLTRLLGLQVDGCRIAIEKSHQGMGGSSRHHRDSGSGRDEDDDREKRRRRDGSREDDDNKDKKRRQDDNEKEEEEGDKMEEGNGHVSSPEPQRRSRSGTPVSRSPSEERRKREESGE